MWLPFRAAGLAVGELSAELRVPPNPSNRYNRIPRVQSLVVACMVPASKNEQLYNLYPGFWCSGSSGVRVPRGMQASLKCSTFIEVLVRAQLATAAGLDEYTFFILLPHLTHTNSKHTLRRHGSLMLTYIWCFQLL